LARLHLAGARIKEIPVSLDFQFSSSVGIGSGMKAVADTLLIFIQLKLRK
jgi:hypothetical protein